MLDGAAFVVWCAMLTNMLNAPVAELTMCKDDYLPQYFFNGGPLLVVSTLSRSISNFWPEMIIAMQGWGVLS
jgi:hypothetical protein